VDAEAFALDLERALAGKPVSAHHFTHLDQVRHFVRQNQRALSLVLLVALAATAIGYYLRLRVVDAHYRTLVPLAWNKNSYIMAQLGKQADPEQPVERSEAWQQMRLARRAVSKRDWSAAIRDFQAAATLSISKRDFRLASIAHVEQARCQTIEGRRDEASSLYLGVLENTDAPPDWADTAQLEVVTLTLLAGNRDAAKDILKRRESPPDGPIHDAIECLAGDLTPAALVGRVDTAPRSFVNDLYLIAAVRSHLDGNNREALNYLKRAAESSSPRMEWPGPLALILDNEFRR